VEDALVVVVDVVAAAGEACTAWPRFVGSRETRIGLLVSPPNHSEAERAGVIAGEGGNRSSANSRCDYFTREAKDRD
jgi:hypothetical protein